MAYGEHRDNGLFRCVRGKADLLLLAVADREVNNELMLELLVVMGHVCFFLVWKNNRRSFVFI